VIRMSSHQHRLLPYWKCLPPRLAGWAAVGLPLAGIVRGCAVCVTGPRGVGGSQGIASMRRTSVAQRQGRHGHAHGVNKFGSEMILARFDIVVLKMDG